MLPLFTIIGLNACKSIYRRIIIWNKLKILAFASFCLLVSSCDKEEVSEKSCFSGMETVREIKNKPARITILDAQYYIVEEGTIDTILKPCDLKQEFQVNNLLVRISGEVKKTNREGICCVDNFVVTQIYRR